MTFVRFLYDLYKDKKIILSYYICAETIAMFSSATQYALRAILYLSQSDQGKKFTVDEVAEALDLPKPFLGKIMQQLARNQLISSLKGRGGGFYLTSKNLKKKLMDVVICMEGENIFNKCILGLPQCSDKSPCFLHQHYKLFRNNLDEEISKSSLNKLMVLDE